MKEQTTRTPPKLRVLSAFLAVAMLLTLLPAAAFAAPAPESDFEYGASNGRAIIRKYKGAGGTVEIPATLGGYPVTGIKMQAFIECTSLKSVSMPESMTWIGDSAFAGCTGLEQVEFSPNLTTIGPNSFYSCNGLTSVVVPDKVTSIESLAFFGCLKLESITIPASVTTLDSTFVFGCTNLKKIEFKGTQAQWNALSINPHYLPVGVSIVCADGTIGGGSDPNVKNYSLTVCGKAVTSANCDNILEDPAGTTPRAVYDPDSKTLTLNGTIKAAAADTQKTGAIIKTEDAHPHKVEGDYTYEITTDGNVRILAYDGSEADVVVPATLGGRDVTEIGNSARTVFDANAAIRSITFPDTLKEMSGLPLFYGCENLETITIPASVTGMNFHSVADCFIFNCPNLKTIIFKGTRAQWEAIEKESVNLDGITVRCSDDNVDPVQPDPGDPDDKDVFLQFEDCSVDVEKPDGTTLHFDALTGVIQSQRLPKGTKVTITLDEKAIPEGMKFSCWVFDDPRPEDLMEDGTTATFTMQEDIGVLAKFYTLEEDDSSADFGTIAAATAVVGVVGATAYLVGTEVALNQLLPAGTSVPQDRAQLALLLWNTAGRPEPAALPAFADVTDPDTAKAAQWCVEAGFFQPREDGNFKPGKHVSRWKVLRTYQRIVK